MDRIGADGICAGRSIIVISIAVYGVESYMRVIVWIIFLWVIVGQGTHIIWYPRAWSAMGNVGRGVWGYG